MEWSKNLPQFSRAQVKYLANTGVLLGQGNFGSVYKNYTVWGESLPPVVVKVSKKKYFKNDLEQETKFLHLLDGAGGAPKLLAYSLALPAIITTYTGDQTLRHLLHKSRRVLSDTLLLEIAIKIGQNLMEIHELNIVHNDLHCDNILVTLPTAKQDLKVSIIDFGLGKMTGGNLDVRPGTGKNQYWMCPQVRVGHPSTTKSDVYSYGIILNQILDELQSEISQELADLVQATCLYNSCDRPPVCALLQELQRTLEYVRLQAS
ncbi:dual specificity protein kinase shkD-like [Homarus americanus]|uniref:dual specificity protein kinase shkD-like n=1 Tax=Homarus americanus TaxID=6706 RepID=UPI001C439919|nr:dual specificity protein kinase shkD-like [Homarus americanus]